MKPRFSILIILLSIISFNSDAQLFSEYNFKFKNYTTQNGLVHNFTRKCRMDSKGFLWIITQNGLSRFDGYTFKNFQHIPGDSTSLPFNDLLDMDIDSKDRVWLGYATGLCYYDQVKKEFHRIKGADQAISLVYDKRSETIWYNSQEKGLNKVPLVSMEVKTTKINKAYTDDPFCMTIDSHQQLWIGVSRTNALRYDIQADTFTTTDHNWVRNFYEDSDGTLWVCSWGGVLHEVRNNQERSYNNVPHEIAGINPILYGSTQSQQLTGNNILWVVTHNAGLLLFDKQQKKFIKNIRYNPSVRSGILNDYNSYIYTDRNGIMWVCSWFGLSMINQQEQQFHSAELPDLKTDLFNLLAGIRDDPYDKNIAWLIVNGLGLAKYDKSKDKVIQWCDDFYKSYDWIWTTGSAIDDANRIWTCTYGGLISIDRGKLTRHEIKYENRFTYPDGFTMTDDHIIWLYGDEGVVRFDTRDLSYVVLRNNDTTGGKQGTNDFDQVQQVNNNTLLAASTKGLYKIDIPSGNFQLLNIPSYSNTFRSLQVIGDHAYAGGDDGLIRYHIRSGRSERLGEKEGISSLNVGSLFRDSLNKLWIYGMNGLFRYDPVDNSFKKFTSADGIYNNSNDRSELFSYNKNIYIGYRMAYTGFDPSEVDVNRNTVMPLITDVRIGKSSLKLPLDSFINNVYKFRHRNNIVTIDFTGIDYTNAERISFAYKLEGYDNDWIQAGTNRAITYSNLPGGNYTFKVKAANSSGIWNETPAQFKFYIIPPVLQRWWFKLLAILAISGILYFLYRRRIQQIRKRQKEKSYQQQLELELTESELEKYKQQLELEQVSNFFSTSLVSKNNAQEVMDDVASNLIGKLGFEDCMIYLWNKDKTKLVQYAGHGAKGAVEYPGTNDNYNIPAGKGIIGAAVASGKTLVVNDVTADQRYFTADGIIRGSEMCVPLIDDGEVIGAINIEQTEKGSFNNRHQHIVGTIAAMTVSKLKAIESTQSLYQKELELSQTSQQLAETELAMLRSQMNPHFIFNSLNSVQKYIWENKEEDAAEYLAQFAKLMRAILENSRKNFVTLREEIDTMKIYTELEHRRSNGRFDYTIRIAGDIDPDKTTIPPMLLQPFIENAIWHGLSKKDQKGNLAISVHKEDDQLVCIVDDDGVGRGEQKETGTEKRSLGIEITRQRIESLMQSSDRRPSIVITDKKQNGNATGTKVTITLPLHTI